MEEPIDERQYNCNDDEIYDPVAYACIALNSSKGRLIDEVWRSKEEGRDLYSDCNEGYILNPVTGNCIQENGANGRLIRRVLDAEEGEDYTGQCPENMRFDSETGRCTRVDGGIRARGGIGQYTCSNYPRSRDEFVPHEAQAEIADYFVNRSEKSGLLLYWELGMGKTCASALIIDELLDRYHDIQKVFILSPGSLRDNFLSQYCSFCGRNRDDVANIFTFITYNYTNIRLPPPEEFDNSIIVIDEVHRIVNGARNRSTTYVRLYETLLNVQNSFIVALTGTPVTRSIEDLYFLIEMLGNEFENQAEYLTHFSRGPDGRLNVPNESLRPILAPYISRVSSSTNPQDFPTTRTEFITVPMGEGRQYSYYRDMVARERAFLSTGGSRRDEVGGLPPDRISSAVRYLASTMFLSRRASVMAYPLEEIEQSFGMSFQEIRDEMQRSDLSYEELERYDYPREPDMLVEDGGWIDEKFINEDMDIVAPKIATVIDFIAANPNGKHVVYSEFKTRFGIYLIAAVLKYLNIPHLMFTGDLNDRQRGQILRDFNSPDNIRGEKYRVILITEAGELGINLMQVRWAHIMEPSINEFRLKQVFGRFSRYRSHAALPPDERNVTIYRYMSLTPGEPLPFDGTLQGINSIPNQRKTTDFTAYERGLSTISNIEPLLQFLDTFPTIPE